MDVLLIGTPDRDAAYEAARRAQERLGREVNVTVRGRDQWENGDDAFTRQLRQSPQLVVPVTG